MSQAQEIVKLVKENGVDGAMKTLLESHGKEGFRLEGIALGPLYREFDARSGGKLHTQLRAAATSKPEVAMQLLEADDAIDASQFRAITGQILFNLIKERYESPEFIADNMTSTIEEGQSEVNLDVMKVPYLTGPGRPKRVQQGELYPHNTVYPNTVTLPPPEKWGDELVFTWEAVMSDKTGQLLTLTADLMDMMRYNQEEQFFRVLYGLVNTYTYNGTTMNTYASSAGAGKYVNKLLSFEINDYNDFNKVLQTFTKMRDPVRGTALRIKPVDIMVMPEKVMTIKRILNATTVRVGDITTGAGTQTEGSNPLDWSPTIYSSPIAYNLLKDESGLTDDQIANTIIVGDFQKAFKRRRVLKPTVTQAPPENPAAFHQDIVENYKSCCFESYGVYDPRYAAKLTKEVA